MGKDIAIGARDVGFDSWADQIRHSAAKVLPTLQYFFGAVLPSAKVGPAICYTILRNAESIMKIQFFLLTKHKKLGAYRGKMRK